VEWLRKSARNLYQSRVRPWKQRLYRLGYAAQGTDYQFSKEVSESLQRATAAEGIELICLDNRYSAKTAQRNAELLVREKVDLAIEFQTDEEVAPIVAAKYREARIPMIAIDIPHPGATYYGANNYEAGDWELEQFGNQPRTYLLNQSIVRCQARSAAALLYRSGVASQLKPCTAPG
jgi:ribose transport system substrate-binding protein